MDKRRDGARDVPAVSCTRVRAACLGLSRRRAIRASTLRNNFAETHSCASKTKPSTSTGGRARIFLGPLCRFILSNSRRARARSHQCGRRGDASPRGAARARARGVGPPRAWGGGRALGVARGGEARRRPKVSVLRAVHVAEHQVVRHGDPHRRQRRGGVPKRAATCARAVLGGARRLRVRARRRARLHGTRRAGPDRRRRR